MSPAWQKRTPQRTLAAILASNLLILTSFSALDLRSMRLTESQSLPVEWKIFGLIPAFLGIVGALLFQRSLGRSMKANLWSAASIDDARAVAESPWWTGAMVFSFFLSFAVFVVSTRHNFSWPTIMIASSLSEVRRTLRPVPPQPGTSNSIYPVKPLVSDHWGLPSHAE